MIVGDRQIAPSESVSQVDAAAPGNLVGGAAERYPEGRHLGPGEQLQHHPASDLTTVSQLCRVIIDCLGIANVAIAAETVQHTDRILSRQCVVVTGAKDRVVRIEVSSFAKTED